MAEKMYGGAVMICACPVLKPMLSLRMIGRKNERAVEPKQLDQNSECINKKEALLERHTEIDKGVVEENDRQRPNFDICTTSQKFLYTEDRQLRVTTIGLNP